MRNTLQTLIISTLILITGCVGASPQSTFYVLDGTTPAIQNEHPLDKGSIGVGPVTLPDHLDRPQIVTRTGQNRIFVNEFDRWGGSLEQHFAETLTGNLSTILQTPRVTLYPWERPLRPDYQVFVSVRRFDGEMDKGITLDAVWQLVATDTNESKRTQQFTTFIPASGSGMTSYVEAQSTALEALSQDIAKGINSVILEASTRETDGK